MGKDKRYHNSNIVLCSINSNIFRLTMAAVFLVLVSSILIVSTVSDSDDSYADTNGECGNGLTWSCADGTLTISKSSEGTGAMNDYTDTSRAPWSTSAFTSVVIGDGVTSIGNYAFKGCTGMTSVTIPNSVIILGEKTFFDCTGLTSVIIPDSVTSMDIDTFYGCTGLTSATIGSGLTLISTGTFNGCTKLTSITIPNSVESIKSHAFNGCTRLTSIIIPNGVTFIGDYAFNGCTGLASVIILNGVTSIGNYTFNGCTGLTLVIIPDSVTSISDSAFRGCSSLTSVTIPDSVTSIGSRAFSDCTSLTLVAIGAGVTSLGNHAFASCTRLTSVTIPDSVTSIGGSAFNGCTGLISVVLGDGLRSMGSYAFYYCSNLTSVVIGNSVTSINAFTFSSCGSLTSVNIPSSVTSIGQQAFFNCTRLTSISIPSSVTSIGLGAFYGCYSLTSVIIPDSVTSIGQQVFRGCSGLISVVLGDDLRSIGGLMFFQCANLSYVSIPSSVTSVADRGFSSSNSLVDIALTGTESSFNMAMSNGVLSGNKLTTASCNLAKIIIDGYVDLKGLSSNTSPSFKLIFAEGVTKDQVIDSSGSAATSDIRSATELAGHVYKYEGGKWVEDNSVTECTTMFNANGGSGSFSKRVTVVNSKIILPTPVKPGHVFEGWHLSANLDDAAVSTEYTVTGDVVLYAKYTEKSYTITYNSNGGSGSIDAGTPTYSELHTGYNLKPCTFTPPAGMAFLGWTIGFSSLYNENATISDDVISGNVVVRAIWSPNVNVTFDAYGGSMNQAEKIVMYGGKYGDLPTVTRVGYTFNGWDFAGTKITALSTVYTPVDHTLTALWLSSSVEHSIKVSFDSNSGSHVGDISVEYGSTYGPLPTVTRAGYTFGGWFTSSTGGTLVSSMTNVTAAVDHTLFAHWSHSINASAVDPNAGNHGFSVGDYIYPIIAAITLLSMLFFIFVLLKRRKEKE